MHVCLPFPIYWLLLRHLLSHVMNFWRQTRHVRLAILRTKKECPLHVQNKTTAQNQPAESKIWTTMRVVKLTAARAHTRALAKPLFGNNKAREKLQLAQAVSECSWEAPTNVKYKNKMSNANVRVWQAVSRTAAAAAKYVMKLASIMSIRWLQSHFWTPGRNGANLEWSWIAALIIRFLQTWKQQLIRKWNPDTFEMLWWPWKGIAKGQMQKEHPLKTFVQMHSQAETLKQRQWRPIEVMLEGCKAFSRRLVRPVQV